MRDSCVSSSCSPVMFVVVMFVALCSAEGAWRKPNDSEVDRKFQAWNMLDSGAPEAAMPRPIRSYVDEEMEREMEMRIPEGSGDGDDEDGVDLGTIYEIECPVELGEPTTRICNFTGAPVPSRLPPILYRLSSLTKLEIYAAEQLQLQRTLCLEVLNFSKCKQIPKVDLRGCVDFRPEIGVAESSVGQIVGRYKGLEILGSQIKNLDIYVTSSRQNHIMSTTIDIMRSSTSSTANLHNASYGGINIDSGSLILVNVNVTELGRGGFNVTDRGKLFLENVRVMQSSPEGIIISGHQAVVDMKNLRVGGVIRNARFESLSSEPLLIHPLRMFRSKEPPVSKTLATMLCLLGFLLGILAGSLGTYFCCAFRLKSGKIQINVPAREADEGARGRDSERIPTARPEESPSAVQGVSYLTSNQSVQSLGRQRPEEPLQVQHRPPYQITDNGVLNQNPNYEPLYQDTDTEALYQNTSEEPLYQDTGEPLFGNENEEQLYQDTGEEPIYGNIQRLETPNYGAINKDTRDRTPYKGEGDDEPLYDTTDDEPIYGNLGGEPNQELGSPQEPTLDQEEPLYGNIGGYSYGGCQRPHEQASTSQYDQNEDEEIYANLAGGDDEIYANL